MKLGEIRERLASLGALPEHQARVLRDWVQGAPHERGRRRPADYLPKAVRAALPQLDAELAVSKSQSASARKAADELLASIKTLRQEAERGSTDTTQPNDQ